MAVAAEFRRLRSPFVRNGRGLGARPIHDRDAAYAVFWAAFDDAVAIGHVYQHVALAVEETNDLQCLEQETAALVENPLPVLQFAGDFDRPDLATGYAGVAGVLRDAEPPFQPTRFAPG